VHDPIAAGRRTAFRAVAVQAGVVAVVAAAFLTQGPQHALGALVGGAALVLGHALAVRWSLDGVVPAREALVRLMLGTLAKWCVAIGIVAVALAVWRLPPMPVLIGLCAGLMAYLLALNLRPPGRIRRDASSDS
jgi:F0F1-type ATP synthase assembly protein I